MREGMAAALGSMPADVVWEHANLFNPFTCEWEETSFAAYNGLIVGIGDYPGQKRVDLGGARVIPGLIDAHVHIESSLLTPNEYGRLVLGCGTTTVIADPHEIANVAGIEGLRYMLDQRTRTPLDIFYMLPSCVPATDTDMGGAILSGADLAPLFEEEGVLGLGEMMNVPGVLLGNTEVWRKLDLCPLIDGHAPLLRGKDLNAYIFAGIQSDHECTGVDEAVEKLRRGMFIMVREGSTERNLGELIPIINPCTVSRCAFATDDRHADMLFRNGHIDDCIRKAIEAGLEPELAYRMATLSPAEHFGLSDRGALAPGKIADFCILGNKEKFEVVKTFKNGIEVGEIRQEPAGCIRSRFSCAPITKKDLSIEGAGIARVIGLINGQILTECREILVDAAEIPDTDSDILKAVVCDRYRGTGCGVGLVQGFGLQAGAIAGSVAHDSHNIVAVGTNDEDLIKSIALVASNQGGIAAVSAGEKTVLPLECAGLMSAMPYEAVVERLDALERQISRIGNVEHPFMYLSFLSLTVIPHLRLTDRGLFDVDAFSDVSLFIE